MAVALSFTIAGAWVARECKEPTDKKVLLLSALNHERSQVTKPAQPDATFVSKIIKQKRGPFESCEHHKV